MILLLQQTCDHGYTDFIWLVLRVDVIRFVSVLIGGTIVIVVRTAVSPVSEDAPRAAGRGDG